MQGLICYAFQPQRLSTLLPQDGFITPNPVETVPNTAKSDPLLLLQGSLNSRHQCISKSAYTTATMIRDHEPGHERN